MESPTTDDLTLRPDVPPASGRVGTSDHWAMQEAEAILARVLSEALTADVRTYLVHAIAETLMRLLGQMPAPRGQQNVFLAEMGYVAYRHCLERAQVASGFPPTFDTLPSCQQEAFLNFAAAVRRRVVNWNLAAEEVTS